MIPSGIVNRLSAENRLLVHPPARVQKPNLGGFSRLVVAIRDRMPGLCMAAGDEHAKQQHKNIYCGANRAKWFFLYVQPAHEPPCGA